LIWGYSNHGETLEELTMQVTYSKQADALYIRFGEDGEGKVARTEEIQPGILFDYDHEGLLYGIEVLDVTTRVPSDALKAFQIGVLEPVS
jgi:uncharacterized protein YuzE